MADNEAVVRSWFDDFANGRKLDMASELMTSDYTYHDPHAPSEPGPDGMVETIRPYQDALNGRWEIHDLVASGDKVAVRWSGHGTHSGEVMGIAPTGNEIEVEALSLFRLRNGKIAEHWAVWDTLTMLQQLGVVPAE